MEEKKSIQRREHVRTPVSIRVDMRRLNKQELHKVELLKQRGKIQEECTLNVQKDGDPDYVDFSISHLADYFNRMEEKTDPATSYLYDSLIQIDEKLDRILEVVQKDDPKNWLEVIQTVDLSGAGLRVKLTTHVEVGELLEIILRIPGFPLGKLRAYGKVIHVSNIGSDVDPVYQIGVEFINLECATYEAIVAYVFSQQRKIIRKNSWKKEM